MDRRCLTFAIFALAGTLWSQARPPRTRRPGPKTPAAAAQPAPVMPQQEAPAPPPPPPTPEQMPPTAPQVSYHNGQLSIVARNSTLRDILTAVGAQTGAHVDIPAGMGSERIVAAVGPGPARDVVASLLADSPMDYIILGSPTTPGAIASIMLTPTEAGPAGAPPAAQGAQPGQPFRAAPPPPEDENQESEPEPEAQVPQPLPPPQAQEPGPVVPGTVGQPPDMQPQQQNPQGTPQVKTPEQLLQELQRMQQQQQQQQQTPPGPRRTIPQPHDQL